MIINEINNLLETLRLEKDKEKIKKYATELLEFCHGDVKPNDAVSIYNFFGIGRESLRDDFNTTDEIVTFIKYTNDHYLSDYQLDELKIFRDMCIMSIFAPMIYAVARVYSVADDDFFEDVSDLETALSWYNCSFVYKYLYKIIVEINKLEPIIKENETNQKLQKVYALCESYKDTEYIDIFEVARKRYNEFVNINNKVKEFSDIAEDLYKVYNGYNVYEENDVHEWLIEDNVNEENIDKAIEALQKLKTLSREYYNKNDKLI